MEKRIIMSFKLGKRSKDNYNTLHPDLQKIIDMALKVSQVDFTIIEGERTVERQQKLFNEGKSKIDGINKKGKHNYSPSLAFDFIAAVPNRKDLAFDKNHLMYLVGVFTACGKHLLNECEITHRTRSGANWDMDGTLVYDQRFLDMPHIEIIT